MKKLLCLLPLVWTVAFAPHFLNPSQSQAFSGAKPGTGGPMPVTVSHEGYFYLSAPKTVPVALALSGRAVKCVSVDGSPTGLAHPLCGQQIEFTRLPVTVGSGYSIVFLTPSSLSRLPIGLQRLRFSLTGGAFVAYNLIVQAKPVGGPAPWVGPPGAERPAPWNVATAAQSGRVVQHVAAAPRHVVITGILASKYRAAYASPSALGGIDGRGISGSGTRRTLAAL